MKCKKCGYDSYEESDIYCRQCGFTLKEITTDDNAYSATQNKNKTKAETKNKGNKTVILSILCTVAVCAVFILCTVMIVSKNNSAPVSATTTGSYESEKDYDNGEYEQDETLPTPTTKEKTTTRAPKYEAGTRCRVYDYLDGSKSLAVRTSPSKNADSIAHAGKNNYVTVIEDYYEGDGEYIKIRLTSEGTDFDGWILVDYIYEVDDDEGIEHTELSRGRRCRVTYMTGLRLWKKPHSSEEKRKSEGYYAIAPFESTVEIVFDYNYNDNGFVCVEYNGSYGWVNSTYLTVI